MIGFFGISKTFAMSVRPLLLERVPAFIGFTVSGCCSNVITFEKLIHYSSEITTLITFSQYLFIFGCVSLYLRHTSYWTKRKEIEEQKRSKEKDLDAASGFGYQFFIPVLSQVVTGYLGNLVFHFDLSMPTHIIFRSSGTAMTLLLGWAFWGKHYSFEKIVGSSLIAVGTVVFTLDTRSASDAAAEAVVDGASNGDGSKKITRMIGISILLLTTIIGSVTSLCKEQWYQSGSGGRRPEWKEVLYYNYFYGLIIYVLLLPQVASEFGKLRAAIAGAPDTSQIGYTAATFLMNWITQLCCILGVNALVFRISALSLTIVLLVRRFLSLMLSIYFFDNPVSFVGYVGAACVFAGAITYSFGGSR